LYLSVIFIASQFISNTAKEFLRMQKNKNSGGFLTIGSLKSSVNKQTLSFKDWVTQNNATITSHLIQDGVAFVTGHAEKLKAPLSTLILDNRWHYLDKAKKESYRGILRTGINGAPYLELSYYTFRNGGQSIRFDAAAAIKALFIQAVSGKLPPLPQLQQTTQIKPSEQSEPVIDYLARDLHRWNALRVDGRADYLARKGFMDVTIPGVRISRDYIAVKLINTKGAYQGLQTIYNDGQKRFTKGLNKKGHFALIGLDALPEKFTTLHICEGVATAASIFLSIKEPVIAAMDAFNLLPVARALKAVYPKIKIIIWADNDWQKAGKLLPNGTPLGNTGLIHANRTAFKIGGDTRVCTPDFSMLPELPSSTLPHIARALNQTITDSPFWFKHTPSIESIKLMLLASIPDEALAYIHLKASATDFNDLYQLTNIEAIANTTPLLPDIKLALTRELAQYRKYHYGVISPSNFKQAQRFTYDSRFLPKIEFDAGVHLIKSDIGTGKTAVIETFVKNYPNQSVLFVTHLISLVESACARLGLCSYNTCDTYDLAIESRLGICLNSLGKLTTNAPLQNYDVVVIDEVEQVLARLTTFIDQKPLVFQVLQHVMQHAKTLICLDAHLSKTTAQFINATCKDAPVTIHINQHLLITPRTMILHDSGESVQLAAMRELDAGRTAYLAFNSKADAFKTFAAFKTAFPDKLGLYIASDNAGDAANQAFFNDVNAESQKYDFIICTPSVSTGVSIDNGHFDFVGGVFQAHINTANDCMQALGRVRGKNMKHVYCEKRRASNPLDADTISARWLATHQHDLSLMNLTNDGAQVLMNDDYEALCLSVTQSRHVSLNNFYQQFALLCLHEGIDLVYVEEAPDTDTRKQFKQLKQAFVQEEAKEVGEAVLSETAIALRTLMNKSRKTMDDTRSVKKQALIDFYNLDKEDTENIASLASIDNDGRFKRQVQTLELALGDAELARKRFLEQMEGGAQFAADITHFACLQQLYQYILTLLHLDSPQGLLSTSDYHYSAEILKARGFIKYMEAHRDVLKGLIPLPTSAQLERDPIRFLGLLLTRMGLKQKRVGKSELGTYHVDNERIDLLNALVFRRRTNFLGVSIPLDTSTIAPKKTTALDVLTTCMDSIKRFFRPTSNGLSDLCLA